FAELVRRWLDNIIPPPPRPGELIYAVRSIFTSDDDPDWLEAISDEDWARFASDLQSGSQLLGQSPSEATENLNRDISDAVVKLAIQISALGFSPELRSRMGSALNLLPQSPFFVLTQTAVQWRLTPDPHSDQLKRDIQTCWNALVA
ncbi:MAG: hypothetical protein V4692_10365, partial [Bdellovibrionota bacterium]